MIVLALNYSLSLRWAEMLSRNQLLTNMEGSFLKSFCILCASMPLPKRTLNSFNLNKSSKKQTMKRRKCGFSLLFRTKFQLQQICPKARCTQKTRDNHIVLNSNLLYLNRVRNPISHSKILKSNLRTFIHLCKRKKRRMRTRRKRMMETLAAWMSLTEKLASTNSPVAHTITKKFMGFLRRESLRRSRERVTLVR